MADKRCPNCGLWNSEKAIRCDCGYDFHAQQQSERFTRLQKIKADFRRKYILQIVAGVLLSIMYFSREMIGDDVVFFMTIIAILGFSFWNWRCPSCHTYLGRGLNPSQCRSCGVQLRH